MKKIRKPRKSWFARAATWLGLVVVFLVSVVAGALLHLDVRAARRLVTDRVNGALAALPADKVHLGELSRLSVRDIWIPSADLQIGGLGSVHVEQMKVRVDSLKMAWSAFTDRNRTVIRLRSVQVALIDFDLRPGPRPETPEEPSKESSKELHFSLDDLAIAHAHVHGSLEDGRLVDADLDALRASAAMNGSSARGTLATAATLRALLPEPIQLDLNAEAALPLGEDAKRDPLARDHAPSVARSAKLQARVRAGQVLVNAAGTLSRDDVDFELNIPETSPQAIQYLLPTAPLGEPASARVRVQGRLPHLDVHADASVGQGKLRSDAEIALDQGPAVKMNLAVRDVDLRAFQSEGPASRLGFDAEADLRQVEANGDALPVAGSISVRTLPSAIAGESVPEVVAHADLDARGIHANAAVKEPGTAIRLQLERSPQGRIDAKADVKVPSLAAVPRLRKYGVDARGRVDLHAEAVIVKDLLSARARLDAAQVHVDGLDVASARIDATAAGPVAAPRSEMSAHVIALAKSPFSVNDLRVSAQGIGQNFGIAATGRGGMTDGFAFQTKIQRGEAMRFLDLSLHVDRRGQSVDVSAPEIVVGSDVAAIEGLRIEGFGQPIQASGRRSGDVLRARIQAPAVELTRVAALLGESGPRLEGKGSLDLSVDIGRGRSQVDGHARLEQAVFGSSPKVDGTLDLGVDGKVTTGELTVRNAEIGGAKLAIKGELGGHSLDAKSALASTGELTLTTDRVSIERLCSIVTCPEQLRRAASSIHLTAGARLDIARGGEGEGGDTKVHAAFDVHDRNGRFVYFSADSRFDLRRTLATHKLPADAPVEAAFGIEQRSLEQFPPDLRPTPLLGKLQVHGYAQGTLAKPFFVVEVAAEGLRYPGTRRTNVPPLDVQWVTTYDLEQAASDLDVRAGSEHVLRASLQANASLEKFLSSRGSRPPWDAGFYADLHGFPLAIVPAVADNGMSGALSGRVSVSGIHVKPEARGDLSIDDVRVGNESTGPAAVSFEVDQHTCMVSLNAGRQGSPASGYAMLRAKAGCLWKDATIPGLDPQAPVEAAFDAAQFRLATLQPALDGVVERLKGTLDARLHASGHPTTRANDWVMQGDVHLRDVNLLPLAVGREIRHLNADLRANVPGALQLERFTGEIGGGKFSGKASADIGNKKIERGHMEVHVAKREAVPLTIEGVSYGTVYGDIYVDSQLTNDQMLVTVRAPTLRAEMPPQRTAKLEKLEDNPLVVLHQPLGPPPKTNAKDGAVGGGPPEANRPPIRMIVTVELGNNVGVSRDDMKVEVMTPRPPANPKLTMDGEAKLEGAIRILGGRIPVAGKVFNNERGVVRFGGNDSGNPSLDIDADYEGGDASPSRIMVHVGGTAKEMKLSLRSNPPKPESELLATLAFGEPAPGTSSTTGASAPGGGSSGAGTAAAGVGSAILTTGINQLLSQSIIPIRTSLKAGTATLASASVELTERVRVEYLRRFGASQYGQQQDVNQFAFDWRFRPRWMLRAQVGDRGTTSLDILWHRWY